MFPWIVRVWILHHNNGKRREKRNIFKRILPDFIFLLFLKLDWIQQILLTPEGFPLLLFLFADFPGINKTINTTCAPCERRRGGGRLSRWRRIEKIGRDMIPPWEVERKKEGNLKEKRVSENYGRRECVKRSNRPTNRQQTKKYAQDDTVILIFISSPLYLCIYILLPYISPSKFLYLSGEMKGERE